MLFEICIPTGDRVTVLFEPLSRGFRQRFLAINNAGDLDGGQWGHQGVPRLLPGEDVSIDLKRSWPTTGLMQPKPDTTIAAIAPALTGAPPSDSEAMRTEIEDVADVAVDACGNPSSAIITGLHAGLAGNVTQGPLVQEAGGSRLMVLVGSGRGDDRGY